MADICKVVGCGKPRCKNSKDFCNAHYLRIYRHGRLDLLHAPPNDGQRAAMISAYEAGDSCIKIGQQHQMREDKVQYWLKKWGINLRSPGFREGMKPAHFKGRKIDQQGYVLVYRPEHPNADSRGYVRENRLVLSQKLGRPLRPDEHAHHQNEQKSDNHPDNLTPLSIADHTRLHKPRLGTGKKKEPPPIILCARCKIEKYERRFGLCSPCYIIDLEERKAKDPSITRSKSR